ncbi:MAG: 50S ribosomal protein L3 N(5)-glutamine methyltransferase [Marinicella sp.]
MPTLLKEIFKQSTDYLAQQDVFYGHGVEQAEDEVVLLMMHVCAVDFATLNSSADQVMEDHQIKEVQALLQQRVKEKIPMNYLIGFAVFAGLKFKVDERVLIPRSPFVALIDQGFLPWVDLDEQKHVMDLCTGSGCIGLAIAHYYPNVEVDLVDICHNAITLAEINTKNLKLEQRVKSIESDLFSALDQAVKHSYDLIVANPPYVDEEEYQNLPAEFMHEPKKALVSHMQGMEIPVNILLQAPDFLNVDGYLFMEVGYNDEVLSAVLPQVKFEWLELTAGGQGICVFSRADLLKYQSEFKEFLRSHVG